MAGTKNVKTNKICWKLKKSLKSSFKLFLVLLVGKNEGDLFFLLLVKMEPFLVVKTCTTFFKNFIFCKSLAPLIENFFLFSKSRRNTRNHFRSQFFILVKELVNLEATSITHTHELFCEMSWPQLRSNSNWAHNKIGTPNCSWQSDSC